MLDPLHRLHDSFLDYSLIFKNNSRRTTSTMRTMFRMYLHVSGAETIRDFTLNSVEDWLSHGHSHRDWSPKTIHLYRCYMSLFADWCVRKELLRENFVDQIPKPRLPKVLPRALDEEDCGKLVSWVRSFPFTYKFERMRAIAIICMFLGTGIRRSELENLEVADVDLDHHELTVRQGKGRKDRRIPFRPSLTRALEDYLKERKRLKKSCPYFFCSMRYDAHMGEKVVQRLVTRLRTRSGICFTPHVLRHSYATRMLNNGIDVRQVQDLLGHAALSTTAMYLSVAENRLTQDVRAMGVDV